MVKNKKYPDARIKAVNDIFKLICEELDWKPEKITITTLKILGISPSKESNTIFLLKFLGIIDESNTPTNEFDNLRNNFQEALKNLVNTNYKELFQIIPIRRISQDTLLSFFLNKGYSVDTSEYQAKLFLELCHLSEIELPNIGRTILRARMSKKTDENKHK